MATSKKTIVASPKKRVVVKRATKISKEPITPRKATRKKAAKKPVEEVKEVDSETVIAPPLKVKKVAKEEVQLPTNVSLRTKSKVEAIADIIDHLEQPFFVIAYVSAACFVAVGLSLIASSHFKNADFQLAELITTSTTSISGTDTSDPNLTGSTDGGINTITETVTLAPTFELLEPLPSVIDNDLRVLVNVARASQVQVKAYSKSSTKAYDLPAERASNTSWRFTVPAKTLPAGEYIVRLQATSETGSGVYSFTVGSFVRPEVQTTSTTNTTNTTGTSNTSTTNTSGTTEPDTTTTTEQNTDTNNVDTQTEESVPSTTEPITTIISEVTEKFEVIPPSSPLTDFEAIRILAPEGYSKIEVYVRPVRSTQQIFVGSAFKNDNRWSLAFNTNNVPNGSYLMHAVATYQTQRIYSKAVAISIYNEIVMVKTEEPKEVQDDEPTIVTTEKISTTSTKIERNFYTYEENSPFVPLGEETEEAEEETSTLLEEEKEDINELLKNYAIATQADSKLLEHTLNQDFDAVREEIIRKVLEEGNSEMAEQIDNALKARFDELKKRVDSFEELRSSRTNSDIEVDFDKDGISDFDEEEVYGTDPLNPDTDNDGFLDGVEVVRGFDPKDSRSEAVVEFELPQTTVGLARTDILEVHEVRPLIENDESLEKPKVQTEITGKGLPNSFITLYIFSTPTIVTIKTDADGSFTYTFDKELEDGEHEVYVAFTDNTGSIMAHSEPFRFVKEAEAFTPVGAAENDLVTAPSLIENSRAEQTNTVIGLGILAFGIILLMLGMSIRPKKADIEQASV